MPKHTYALLHTLSPSQVPTNVGRAKADRARPLKMNFSHPVLTDLGENGESPLALQRRPSQVSAPHPKTKSYATAPYEPGNPGNM